MVAYASRIQIIVYITVFLLEDLKLYSGHVLQKNRQVLH